MTKFSVRMPGFARSNYVLAVAVASALALGAIAANALGASQGRATTRVFLIASSDQGIHYGKFEDDCPAGFELTVEQEFVDSLSPTERERLLKPENAVEYGKKWKDEFITGPGGENVCNNPKSFLSDPRRRVYRGVSSKVSYGLDLDGTTDGHATAKTCAHEKFQGLNGEPLVDNQLYRAIGCDKLARGTGPAAHQYLDPFLIEVRGLGDPKNSDHLDLGIYSTDGDVSLKGPDAADLAYQTFTVTRNPRWRTTVKARMVDGVMMTDVIPEMYLHWVMSTWGALGQVSEHEYRDVRFRLTLTPDGKLAGVMAAYRPLDNIFTVGYCCKGTASTANNDCASQYKTLVTMADGYPDPSTGQCTMISAATNITGIPAFLAQPSRDAKATAGASSR